MYLRIFCIGKQIALAKHLHGMRLPCDGAIIKLPVKLHQRNRPDAERQAYLRQKGGAYLCTIRKKDCSVYLEKIGELKKMIEANEITTRKQCIDFCREVIGPRGPDDDVD